MSVATISVVYFSTPSLSVYLRVFRRPSTYTGRPFFRNSPAISAMRSKKVTRCHSVSSWRSPLVLSFHCRLVAMVTLQIAEPLGM